MACCLGVLLAFMLASCATVPIPSSGPTPSSQPTDSPSPTPFPTAPPLNGEFVGFFTVGPGCLLFYTDQGVYELNLRSGRYDFDTRQGRRIILDNRGSVVGGEYDRIGVNGKVGQAGSFCMMSDEHILDAVIVDVDPEPAPFSLQKSRRGVRYPFQIKTHCGLEPVQLIGSRFWDFEGPTGDSAPPGFGDPFDVGTVVFHNQTHAIYTSSGGVTIGLRRFGVREPDPTFADCPVPIWVD